MNREHRNVPRSRRLANLTRIVALAGLVAALPAIAADPAGGAAPCEPRPLGLGDKSIGWAHQPLSKLKKDTLYTLTRDEGATVLRAEADGSASAWVARLKTPIPAPAFLSWRWKTGAFVPGADNRDKDREDAPVRVIAAFDGNRDSLPGEEQRRFRRAKALSGRELPFATLMYIWSEQVPVETVIPSAHTSQVKMLVVASGPGGLGSWQTVRRDVASDYRKAFGGEPGALLGVAFMTDTDNTGKKATGWYADLRFECAEK